MPMTTSQMLTTCFVALAVGCMGAEAAEQGSLIGGSAPLENPTAGNSNSATSSAVDAGSPPSQELTGGPQPVGGKLGSITSDEPYTCDNSQDQLRLDRLPAGYSQICRKVTVHCPDGLGGFIDDLQAVLAITKPAATIRGTVISHAGGEGERFLDPIAQTAGTTVMTGALADALQVVQAKWLTSDGQGRAKGGWELASYDGDLNKTRGVMVGACRPATLFKYVHDTYHATPATKSTKPFCAVGKSGGSAAVAYALAHYGADQASPGGYLDYAAFIAGPPLARMDVGCQPQSQTVFKLPPSGPNQYVVDTFLNVDHMNDWNGLTTANSCGDPAIFPNDGSGNYNALLRKNSVVPVSGGLFKYPKTHVWFGNCVTGQLGTSGGASAYAAKLEAAGQPATHYTMAVYENASPPLGAPFIHSRCAGEGLDVGFEHLITDIQTNCKVTE